MGLAIVLAAVLTAGCGVLEPRDANPPDTGPDIPFENPVEPQIVLDNIEATLEAKSEINYRESLAPDFIATALGSSDNCGIVEDGWTREDEIDLTRLWTSTEATIALDWSPPPGGFDEFFDEGTSPDGEEQRRYEGIGYTLTITEGEQSITYSGLVNMYFREVAGVWIIYRWDDLDDGSSNFTWTRIRCVGQVELGP